MPATPHPVEEPADWEEPAERLIEALKRDAFELYAQRIIALDRPRSTPMAEVLVRMREEEERLLPPGTFLPVFERLGMMPDLDRWVMRRAIARLARGSRVPSLSLNVSAQTLSDPEFLSEMAAQLARHRLRPAAVVLEITADDILGRPGSVEQFAAAARRLGTQITIDGFGSAESSAATLRAVRPNYVKVDRSIVCNVARSQAARRRLEAAVRIGRKTGMGVICECVETREVLAAVRSAGAGFAQGYGIHAPEPIARALAR